MWARRTATAALVVAVALSPGAISATRHRLPAFRDVARSAGIDFVHISGASEQRFFPEIVGSGGLFFDFDNDGWLDIFLVDGGSLADAAVASRARHRLYRNRGPSKSGQAPFEDVTATSGIRHRDYGMGACAGDYDNDGLIDLYVTNVGSNLLYRNAGRGRFTEVPNAGGANPNLWSTSCAFLDIDRDGDLDLFVTNYVDARRQERVLRHHRPAASQGLLSSADLSALAQRPLSKYRTDTFEDISKQSWRRRAIAVTDSASPLPTSMTMAGRMSSWPTTRCPTSCFTTTGTGRSLISGGLSGVAVASDGKAKGRDGDGLCRLQWERTSRSDRDEPRNRDAQPLS